MAETATKLPPLLPGQVVPAAYDAQEVKEDAERIKDAKGLFIRDEVNAADVWRRRRVRLNPASHVAQVLEGLNYNLGDAQTVLLMVLVESMLGGDVLGEEDEKTKKGEKPVSKAPITGSVAGGSPEGPADRSPTTGPSATGGERGTSKEDAKAAHGAPRGRAVEVDAPWAGKKTEDKK